MATAWRPRAATRGASPSHMRPWSQPPCTMSTGGSAGSPHSQRRIVVRPRSTNAALSGSCRSSTRCLERQVAQRGLQGAVLLPGLDDVLGDRLLVDLVGAVGEARPAGLLQHVGERRIGGIPEGPVHLDRTVDDLPKTLGDVVLGERDLLLEREAGLDLVGGV